MSMMGMYVINTKYDEEKTKRALDVLYMDRKNQFQELAQVILGEKVQKSMPNWREFVLNFSLDIEDAFLTWSNQASLSTHSPQKALTILRQLGCGKKSMNQLVHMMNMSYNLSTEFKEIYKRIS